MIEFRKSTPAGNPAPRRAARKLCLSLAGCLLLAAAGPAWAAPKTLQPGKLVVCLFPNFQPFVGKDAKGVWSGWDYDYLSAFAKQQGLQLEVYESKDFDGIWNLPGADKCDIAGSGISDLLARRNATGTKGVWSNTYYYVLRSFAVKKGDKLNGLADLAGKRVIVTENSTADLDLSNRIDCNGGEPKVEIVRTNDETAAVKEVSAGKAFAYGGGLGSIETLVAGTNLEVAFTHRFMTSRRDGCAEVSEPFSFVVRAASTGLIEAFNAFVCAGAGYPGNKTAGGGQ